MRLTWWFSPQPVAAMASSFTSHEIWSHLPLLTHMHEEPTHFKSDDAPDVIKAGAAVGGKGPGTGPGAVLQY